MSGFQIPGLGQAKPNETLPPLQSEPQAQPTNGDESNAMTVDSTTTDKPDTNMTGDAEPETKTSHTEPQLARSTDATDAMVVDRPESPPSLTGALEAAIGGLDEPQAPTEEDAETREQQQLAEAQAQQVIHAEAQTQPETTAEGAHPEWEADSSPYESSSDSSSSDSSDDDDDDDEPYELLSVEETARLLMEAEGGSDDEGDRAGKGAGNAHVKTKNEVIEEAIPKPDVTITPEMKIEELGSIQNIVEGIALIKAITPGEYQVLDTGSVLCTTDRVVIGAVAETIGKVLQPLYTVRFSSTTEPAELGLEVGTKIFYPVDHAHYVFTEPLKNLKGSDASNIHDEEVGDDEMEFSDDEKEAEYKRSLKQKKREKARGGGSARGGKEPHPLRQEMQTDGGLNYDDDDDGPYKPLTRPPGFGSGPVSTETYDPQPRGGFRGRRGDARGRGGRGRGGRGGRGGGNGPRDGYSLPPQGQQQQFSPQPPSTQGQWGAQPGAAAPAAPTALPGFGFQMPGWPPQGPAGSAPIPPPPPPGWPAQGQQQQAAPQGQANQAFNPALFAALLSQMQQSQQGGGGQQQQPWGGQPPQGQ
ncbi:gar1/Naf1 RNA binding region domain-containing protein [Sarocladium implicatum]|nr:gar1/Naf1 RNA binding region domain-containing protein [Sarocladium implicatum]